MTETVNWGWWLYTPPDPQARMALGNLVGFDAWCDECKCRTDHDGDWHRQRFYPPEIT